MLSTITFTSSFYKFFWIVDKSNEIQLLSWEIIISLSYGILLCDMQLHNIHGYHKSHGYVNCVCSGEKSQQHPGRNPCVIVVQLIRLRFAKKKDKMMQLLHALFLVAVKDLNHPSA